MLDMNPQLQALFQQAIQAFQDGNFDSADLMLQKVLENDVNASEAIFDLAITFAEVNKFSEALAIFYSLKRCKGRDARIPFSIGIIHSLEGKYKLALEAYDLAIQLQPNYVEALINKSAIHNKVKDFFMALKVADRAIKLNKNYYEAYVNRGNALHGLKRYNDAIENYDKALSLKPDCIEVLTNKGVTFHELKQYDEAIAQYDQAISLRPNDYEAWSNKGASLRSKKRYDEALVHCDKAINLKPDYAEAWSNKGLSLHELKLFVEAIAQYDKAINLKPDYAEAWSNKGLSLHELKRYDEALAHYDKALSLKPDYAEGWSNKGLTLHELKRYDEAIAHYDKALSLKPDIDWIAGDLLHTRMKICSWSGLNESLEDISKKVVANEKVAQSFSLLALSDEIYLHKKTSEIYASNKYPLNPALGSIPKSVKKEKIRIAYFSPDFRNHPVSFLTAELYELHDRSRFEVFAFSLQKAPIGDETNLRLSKGFDRFIDVENMSDRDIAQLARKLEIDIAIDLAGPTQFSRTKIFSYQAAPIQVNWLGYPGTIGANFIDYIVADKTLIPESHQQYYCEKVVYLPNSYQVNDRKRAISDRQLTRQELGLPKGSFVFCCFNNNYKILPGTFASWMRILKAVEGSVLWLFQDNSSAVENLKREAEKRGISADRLVFAERLPLPEHLARHRQADLFLDTFPYNAHTTTSDALWAGLPVLTLMGQSFASRVAASLLNAIELPELVTNSQEEYEVLAIELAMNPQKLADIKLKLASNRLTAPLFNTPLFTKNLEAAYLKMYERYQADLKPEHILLDSQLG